MQGVKRNLIPEPFFFACGGENSLVMSYAVLFLVDIPTVVTRME